jgi:hypothetical protein
MWILVVPVNLPSANDRLVNGRDRVSRAVYQRTRNGWAYAIKAIAMIAGVPLFRDDESEARVRHITITRLWGKGCRAFDDDDLTGGAKGFRDACQRPMVKPRKGKVPTLVPGAGLVWDDSARWSSWSYGQRKSDDGRPGVEVIVRTPDEALAAIGVGNAEPKEQG